MVQVNETDTRISLESSRIQTNGSHVLSLVPYHDPILARAEAPTGTRQPNDEGLSLDEILACVAILTILGLVAVCLLYFCIKKYCCRTRHTSLGPTPHLELWSQSSLTNSSLNQNELPSVQRAVDGSQSPASTTNEPIIAANNVSPEKIPLRKPRAPATRSRSASPGQRAISLDASETIRSSPTPPRKGSSYQLQKAGLARKSQLSTSNSLAGNRPQSDQRHQQQKQTRKLQAVAPTDPTINPNEGSQGNSEVVEQVKSVAKSQIMQDISHKGPLQTVQVNDVPITADLILRQSKDTKREYSLFKSPHLYD